jgi:hypothetical protein
LPEEFEVVWKKLGCCACVLADADGVGRTGVKPTLLLGRGDGYFDIRGPDFKKPGAVLF